jgi:hypothetical protein
MRTPPLPERNPPVIKRQYTDIITFRIIALLCKRLLWSYTVLYFDAPHPAASFSLGRNIKDGGRGLSKARQSVDDESAAIWWNLCGRAWTEKDPVKFLEVTMQISKFLAQKQQLLDAAFDEAQRQGQPSNPTCPTPRKNIVN